MRIFFDENLSEHVAQGINLLNKKYYPNIEVVSTKVAIRPEASDPEVIDFVSQEQGIIVSRDKGIAKTQTYYELCREKNVAVIIFKLPTGYDCLWNMVKLIINEWDEIIEYINTLKPPFYLSVTPRGGVKLLRN